MRAIAAAVCAASVVTVFTAPAAVAAGPTCYGERATIVGTAKKDKLNGTSGRDVIVALGGHDVVHGGPGDDVICLGPNEGPTGFGERAFGDKGNDLVSGGPGNESIYGGHGDDVLDVGLGERNWAVGGPGNDDLLGGPGRDVLGGEDGPGSGGSSAGGGYNYAFVPGEPGNDRIAGSGGNDWLIAGDGDDSMTGGKGRDRVVYWSTEPGDYFANLETGRATGAGRDTMEGVEDLHAWTRGDIVLRGDDDANVLLGAPSVESATAKLYGGGADDLLAAQDDWTRRQEGHADLYGGLGNDALVGQCVEDDDRVDELFGGPGADQIQLGCGWRNADGGPGDDTLQGLGEGFAEDLATYDGGPGFDMLVFEFAQGRVEADLQAGTLTMHYEDGRSSRTSTLVEVEGIQGSDGHEDVLLGDDGANVLMGGLSQVDAIDDGDRIEGRGGDDEIYGDDGNDELDGGDGNDRIDGGEDVDTCRNGETVNGCELT